MVTMMTINGRPSRMPYSGHQLKSSCILVNVLCTIPMATPVNTVGQKFRNFPISAAPNAGIKKPKVKMEPFNCTSGAAKIATTAPTTEEITQPEAARKSGECPRRTAPFSFSAAARVASPNRRYLLAAHTTRVISNTMPNSHRPSRGTRNVSVIVMTSRGKIGSTRIAN